jgi:hypothetical protein
VRLDADTDTAARRTSAALWQHMTIPLCYIHDMKAYIHARLRREEQATLEQLKKKTGQTESELVRRGLS